MMASIVRRKNPKFWTARYTARDGRQLERSTKMNDENQAMEIATEFKRGERRAKSSDMTT